MAIVASLVGNARFFVSRLRERLWVKPLAICFLSIFAAFMAGMADDLNLPDVPEITADSIETLLSILSASMLVIAVFSVGAMLSAYASAGSATTPRSFSVIVADDVSQNALSTFIGAFIFSVVALIALENGYYGAIGRFVLFLITIAVFTVVLLGFVRWVDRIARLGRVGTAVNKMEAAAAKALRARARRSTLGARLADQVATGLPVYADTVGYIQRIDVPRLQGLGEKHDCTIRVVALPGTFTAPGQVLAHVTQTPEGTVDLGESFEAVAAAFVIGDDRTFDEDPRFGLLVLAETASRALSPAVNDPGTAIDIVGTLVRLFAEWVGAVEEYSDELCVEFDRVAIPEIAIADMFDDAFNAIARDGAGTIEVCIRLLKGLEALSGLGDEAMRQTAIAHACYVVGHAERALQMPEDLAMLRRTAKWTQSNGESK